MITKIDKSQKGIVIIYWIYVFILTLLTLASLTIVWLTPSELLNLVGLEERAAKVQAIFLTPNRWQFLQTIIGCLLGIWLCVGLLIKRLENILLSALNLIYKASEELYSIIYTILMQVRFAPAYLQVVLVGLWILMITIQIYKALGAPLTYDEIWTYLNFSSRGPLVSIAYYPAPNNHVLYSILSSFTLLLTTDPEWGVRLPTIFASALVYWFLFILLLRHSSFICAICGLFLFYSSYITYCYSFLARGYEFMLLAFIGSLGALLELVSNKSRYQVATWVLFVAFSFMGLAIIPTYIYPLLTEISILIFAVFTKGSVDIKFIKKIFLAGIIICIATLVFYTPILFISGLQALFANKFVIPVTRTIVLKQLPNHMHEVLDWFFASLLNKIFFLACSFAAIFFALVQAHWSRRKHMLMLVLFFVFPIVFMLLQSIVPYPRTWIYLVVVAVLLVSWSVAQLLQEKKFLSNINVISCTVLVCFAFIWIDGLYFNETRFTVGLKNYDSYQKAFNQAVIVSKNQLIVDNDNLSVIMEFLHKVQNRPYLPLRNFSTDSLPNRVLVVHDKLDQHSESIRPGVGGKQHIVYDDTFVRVSEVTLPKYWP